MQRTSCVILFVVALTSAISDGWLEPPDDGGWHLGTVAFSIIACLLAIAAYLLTRRGRVHLSGWMLIISLGAIGSATFITGTVSSVLITIVGVYCLAMVLPPNIFPGKDVIISRKWPAAFISLYIASLTARIVLRDGDVMSYPSEGPYLYVGGSAFIYVVYAMSQRASTRLYDALDESEQAKRELDEINAQLRRRTEELSEALDVANLASAAKGRFLANMSHELRTPLNAILGYAAIVHEELADLAEEERIPAYMLEDLEHVETAGKHLLDLISDVLDLARIEAGQSSLDIERVELGELFVQLGQLMKHEAMRQHNTLDVELDEELVLHTDLVKLRQILFNLLGNAVKFTDHGTITLRAMSLHDDTIRFEVEDTGEGIPEHKQRTLFEPFEQVDSSSTRNHDGAGLGLALCAQLVELLGGTISLKSEQGKGSTFAFTLPRTPSTTPAAPSHPEEQTRHGEQA